MPTVRYQIKNEYGMADPEVYRAAEKDDPEALLEGVAMAGLVGVLRQLGDLAEFAAEVFHDLHEEVMITSARGHGLILRVQQLEAEFPLVEKAILSQTDHSHCAYNAGTDWHPNLRVEQNLVIQGDMPRFILDSYEECRGPPRLFMLDKFDVAGAGACLTRYSNPSFFKTESASFEVMELESKREKRSRKIKPKGSCLKNGEMTNPFLTPIIGYSQVEPVPEKFPARRVKLKHRNLKISDVSNTKSYMESIIHEVLEDLTGGMVDSSILRDELLPHSPEKFQNEKNEGKDFLETKYTLSGVLDKLHPASQTAKEEEMLMELGNELDIHDFDVSSDENFVNHPSLQLAERNDFLHDSGFITDVDRDSYRSDDIGSELENYVDALNTLETEAEADYDNRGKSDPNFFNRQSKAINANNNGYIELQPKSSGSSFIGSFDSLVHSEMVMEAMPSLPQSSNLVDLPYEQLQLRIISASSSKFKINQGEPISRHAISSSSIADSESEPNGNFREVQPLTTHSLEVASGSTASTPEVNEYVESSFLPWKTNHVVVPPTFEESPAVLEEANLQEYNENRISATLTDIDHMPCYTSKTEYFILPEKAPTECSIDSSLTLMDDEIGKPLQSPDAEERIDSISETLSTPMGSITPDLESHDMSTELVIDMQSEYSTMKSTSGYLEGFDDERKQLNSSVASAAKAHELSLLDSEDSGSHGSTQTFDNVVDDSADITDERGSNHESLHSSTICHFSEHTEKTMSNNASNTSQMPEFPQKSCVGDVSTVYAKDSLQGSKDKDNISVKKLLPENSNFSLGIVSSNLQSESLNDEINNVSVTHEEFVHPQFPATSTSPVSDEFEQFPVAEEPQKSANSGILEPLQSVSEENSDATHMQHALELIDINGKDHVNGGLELADESTELDLQHKLLAEESKEDNKSLDGYIITEDGIDGPVLNLLESAKVSTFDLLLIEDPLPDDDALHQLPSKKKSYFPLLQNEEQAMLVNPLSTQTSVSDLSHTLDAKFVDVNYDPTVKLYPNIEGDNISSRENKLLTDSISEDVITKDDIDDKDLSMLKSSNLCSYDLQFQEDPVSEDATFNRHISEIENMDISSHELVSKNVIAEEGNDAQNSSLLESPYAYSFDAHTQEDLVSEDTSNHSLEIEELAITSGLTPLNVEKPVSVVSSSQSLDPYSSNCANDTVSEHNLDDILFEFDPCRSPERLICFREDDQSSYSDTSMQPFQSGAESAEVPSEEASISEQSTLPLHRKVENLEPSNIILNEYFSDRYSIIQHSLDHEVLNEESKLKDFGNHSSHYEMNMPLSKDYVGEQIENDLSVTFQDISEQPGSSMASEFLALPGETNSRMPPLKEGIDEIPPLPLPPVQWRIGKPPSEPLISDRFVPQPVNETNPFIAPLNLHVDQHENPFLLPSAFEKNFQHVFSCTDAQLTQSSNLSEPPQINLDQRKQLDIQFSENGCVHSSGLPLILSYNVDGNHAHGDISMEREDQFTSELRRPKLVKLLPGLELERSQEVSVIGTDAISPFNPFMSMPAIGDGISQYDYGNYGGYEGENLQYQGSSASFPVAIQGFPRYGYHMFLNEGISSTMYDTTLSEMEGDISNGKHRSIRNRQRDPLIEAVAAHDKSTLRKVSELDRPMTKPKEDEPNYLLEQIKEKSFNLKPATSAKAGMLTAPSTNLKVAAILQKANAIRQACVGSDEDVDDNDDNWS